MPDYSKGVIYTIRCRTDTSLIYVGSTIQPLYKRWHHHKRVIYDPKFANYSNGLLYQKMRESDLNDWYIELYEKRPCNDKEELHKREGEVIREIGTLNMRIAGRDFKQYYEDNKEQLKKHREASREKISKQRKQYREANKEVVQEQKKQYYQKYKEEIKEKVKKYREENKEKRVIYDRQRYETNKEKLVEKIMCECGCEVQKKWLSSHRKSKKHIAWEATQCAATN